MYANLFVILCAKITHSMQKHSLLFLFSVCAVLSVHARQNQSYLLYIAEWQEVALANQRDYGVPASIILAQGLLESGAGTSELAREANNHFGIKCTSDWMGGSYYHDDDSKGECFRVYQDAGESYKDHSLFLQRPRYQTCFEIAVEDYAGWAYRLKQCGYATDPLYPDKLIRIIEEYRLDTLATPEALAAASAANRAATAQQTGQPAKKAVVVTQSDAIATVSRDPEPEYEEPLTAYQERQQFFIQHPKKRCNGVQYVEAREGDTYANIAFRLNKRERTLRNWNDALGRDLQVGDRVYLSRKRSYGEKEKSPLWVHPGESLWDICQREGVRMAKVQRLNGFDKSVRVFRTRQQILLRKERK